MASLPPPGFDDCAPINVDLALDLNLNAQSSMALNNINPPPNNIHPNFLESPVAGNNATNNVMPRLIASPLSQQPQHQINNNNGNGIGMNGLNMGLPMNAGHQMDVNMLYRKVVELSEVLRENREKTQGIISGAEELAVCALPFRSGAALRQLSRSESFSPFLLLSLIQAILRQQARAAVHGVNPSLQEASATVTCEANPTAL